MIAYKKFEQLCDMQLELAKCRHDKLSHVRVSNAIERLKDECGFPWKMSDEQSSDWEELCRRIDRSVMAENMSRHLTTREADPAAAGKVSGA